MMNEKLISSKIFTLLFFVFSYFQSDAQFNAEYIIQPPFESIVFSTDSIIKTQLKYNCTAENNFTVIDSSFKALNTLLHKNNELLLFSNNKRIRFYDGIKCANNSLIINNLDTNNFKLDTLDDINTYLALAEKIKNSTLINKETQFKALIVWSQSLGVQKDNNPFEWEKLLFEKFKNNITIIKICIDVNEQWREKYQQEILAVYNSPMIKRALFKKQ
jgi:hypothetical protein